MIRLRKIETLLACKVLWMDLSFLIVIFMVCLYTTIFSYFTILKHSIFRTYAWDLGIFNQALWTTIKHHKLFYSTPEIFIIPSGSFLGTHFSPILFIVLPIYSLYTAPENLLILQSFILALGAIPLYKMSMHLLKSRLMSIIFVSTYLLYPPLHGINWFDFHVQAFLPLFFLSSMYFLEKKNWKMYILFMILSLSSEEHAAFIVAFIGLFIALQSRKQLKEALKTKNFKDDVFLIVVVTISLAVLWYFITLWIRGTFFPVNPAFLSAFKASANWSILGVSDPILIPFYIILYPQRALTALQYEFLIKIGYLLILFGPLAFLSFSKIEYLLPTLPWFVYSLFSNYQPYYVIYDQYPAYVIAFIFVSTLHSIAHKSSSQAKTRSLLMIILFSVVAYLIASPTSGLVNQFYDTGIRSPTQHERFIHEILSYVPANASILTQNNIFPHVSSRINAYAVPIDVLWSRNIFDCEKFVSELLSDIEYVLVDIRTDTSATIKVFKILSARTDFKVLASADGIVLLKKNYNGKALMLAPYVLTYSHSNLNLYAGEIIADSSATNTYILHFNGAQGGAPLFWSSPRTPLPSGNYTVSLMMKIINGSGDLFKVEICSNNGQKVLKSKVFSDHDVKHNSWMLYSINFGTEYPLVDFEIRAVNITEGVDIFLDYIEVKQLA
jgi:uncharacterized membrane protein